MYSEPSSVRHLRDYFSNNQSLGDIHCRQMAEVSPNSQNIGWLRKAAPNLITLFRLVLLPVLFVVMRYKNGAIVAAVLLVVMGASDFVDGYVARKLDSVSTFGKVFDPTSDRVVLIVVAVALILHHLLPFWLAGPLLLREVLVSVLVLILAGVKGVRADVVWIGKAGTFLALAGLPGLMFGLSSGVIPRTLYLTGEVLLAVGTILLYGAGVEYVRLFYRHWYVKGVGGGRP